MRNFREFLGLALGFRWMLAGIVLSSAVAAVFWGANLGSIYPIVDVVLQRQSMRDWVNTRVDDSRREIQRTRDSLALDQTGADTHQIKGTESEISVAELKDRLDAEEERLAWALRMKPWIDRFTPATPFATLQLVAVALLLGTLIKSFFLVINSVLVELVTQHVALEIRSRLFDTVLRADMTFFGRLHHSHLLSHFTHDVECVVVGVRTVLGRAVLEPLKISVCLMGAAFLCWRLLAFSLLVTPLAILVINRLARLVKRANHKALQEMAGIYNRLSEALHGILLVKAFHREIYERERFYRRGTHYRRRMGRIASFTALTKPSNELMSVSVICLALLGGGYLVLNGETRLFGITMCDRPLDFPLLMAFFALLAGVSDPFRKLIDVFSQIQQAAAAAERLADLTNSRTELPEGTHPQSLTKPLRQIELTNVSFSYSADRPVLQGVNLTIQAGETIAIVGPNGSGKSTIFNLLLRLFDPESGGILWDEVDMRDARIADIRARIGIVTQQAFLFDESVMENIRYGCAHASREQAIEAAKKASADGFIGSQLANGYDTIVGAGGKNLSGGQRQRLALARAILRDPELLLLDEATSQIDVESQRLIHESLREFCGNRTTIMITHRPETLSLADRIVVLDEGRVVDTGTESELLQRCPLFQRLRRDESELPALRASA